MIQGKIIQILDEYRVIIDKGYYEDVKEGQKFIIYEEGDEIIDPITNENLGALEIKKADGIIIHVQENFSILKSNKIMDFTILRKNIFSSVEPFDIDENALENSPDHKYLRDKKIRIGDLVRQISD